MYFYPKDDTPGCTIEANQFTELVDEFTRLDTVILGINKDGCESQQAFIDKFGLKVDLLTDNSGEFLDAYGVWQEKEKNSVKKMGIVRSTFVIDKEDNLAEAVYWIVNADGHAQVILDNIQQLSG